MTIQKDTLAIDVGTTAFKMGVFTRTWRSDVNSPGVMKSTSMTAERRTSIPKSGGWPSRSAVQRPANSSLRSDRFLFGTTPGMVPMAATEKPLGPRSSCSTADPTNRRGEIRRKVGEEKFLNETCNLPVSGGSSLCSMLWIRENQPDVWKATARFGHCNTYMVKRFTGSGPSTLRRLPDRALQHARHDLTLNQDVLSIAEIPESKLPPLMQSFHKAGEILPEVAGELGLPKRCDVLCGGNDAVLAFLSGGLTAPGDINHDLRNLRHYERGVNRPVGSPNFNVAAHVIPNRWVTFFVLNAGGIALDWFHAVFCREMTHGPFLWSNYLPFWRAFLRTVIQTVWNRTCLTTSPQESLQPGTADRQPHGTLASKRRGRRSSSA